MKFRKRPRQEDSAPDAGPPSPSRPKGPGGGKSPSWKPRPRWGAKPAGPHGPGPKKGFGGRPFRKNAPFKKSRPLSKKELENKEAAVRAERLLRALESQARRHPLRPGQGFYPLDPTGPLCPLLREPEVLWDLVYADRVRRRELLGLALRFHRIPDEVETTVEQDRLLALAMLDQAEGRAYVATHERPAVLVSLHNAIYRRFLQADRTVGDPLYDVTQVLHAAEQKDGQTSHTVLSPERWGSVLQVVPSLRRSDARAVALWACAFAMMQPADARAILDALVRAGGELFAAWLLPRSKGEGPLSSPAEAEKPHTADRFHASAQDDMEHEEDEGPGLETVEDWESELDEQAEEESIRAVSPGQEIPASPVRRDHAESGLSPAEVISTKPPVSQPAPRPESPPSAYATDKQNNLSIGSLSAGPGATGFEPAGQPSPKPATPSSPPRPPLPTAIVETDVPSSKSERLTGLWAEVEGDLCALAARPAFEGLEALVARIEDLNKARQREIDRMIHLAGRCRFEHSAHPAARDLDPEHLRREGEGKETPADLLAWLRSLEAQLERIRAEAADKGRARKEMEPVVAPLKELGSATFVGGAVRERYVGLVRRLLDAPPAGRSAEELNQWTAFGRQLVDLERGMASMAQALPDDHARYDDNMRAFLHVGDVLRRWVERHWLGDARAIEGARRLFELLALPKFSWRPTVRTLEEEGFAASQPS